MVLYIDETEHQNYFIVGGILAKSEADVELAYKRFKKSVSSLPIKKAAKEKLFLEFKSTIVDERYQRIKFKLLNELINIDGVIIYSCYIKKQKDMKQTLKESVYITLLSNIINSIDEQVEVIFDSFNKKDFEESIVSTFMDFNNVASIKPLNSQWSQGLKFADNVCSVIRLHLTDRDKYGYYNIISQRVKNV